MRVTMESHALSFTTPAHPHVVVVWPERVNSDYFDICRLLQDDPNYSCMVFSIPKVCSQRVAVYCSSYEHVTTFVNVMQLMDLTCGEIVYVDQEDDAFVR